MKKFLILLCFLLTSCYKADAPLEEFMEYPSEFDLRVTRAATHWTTLTAKASGKLIDKQSVKRLAQGDFKNQKLKDTLRACIKHEWQVAKGYTWLDTITYKYVAYEAGEHRPLFWVAVDPWAHGIDTTGLKAWMVNVGDSAIKIKVGNDSIFLQYSKVDSFLNMSLWKFYY